VHTQKSSSNQATVHLANTLVPDIAYRAGIRHALQCSLTTPTWHVSREISCHNGCKGCLPTTRDSVRQLLRQRQHRKQCKLLAICLAEDGTRSAVS
jgi:hypothetical protein